MKGFWKRSIAAAAAAMLLLAGCAGQGAEQEQEQPSQPQEPATLRTGLYTAADFSGSADAQEEADGLVKLQAACVGVIVDQDDRIVSLMIDQIQCETAFDAAGNLIGQEQAQLTSKRDLGAAYGMASVSSIGREWDEQIRSFEEYCTGKTVEELKSISFDEQGKPTDPDLASSVTLATEYFVNYIEAAANSAQPLGASEGDEIALTLTGSCSASSAQGGEDGEASVKLEMAAVTTAPDGTITGCIVDGLEATLGFGADGKLTGDLNERPQTKNQLAESYGMKAQSSIGREWYQQAASLAEYVRGRTAAEVEGITLDEQGKATEPDLRSSVTISINSYTALIARAARIRHPAPAGEAEQNG